MVWLVMTFSDILAVIYFTIFSSSSTFLSLPVFPLHFSLQFTFAALFLSLLLFPFSTLFLFTLQVSTVSPGYALKSKDLELETNKQKEWGRGCNVIIIQSQKDSQKQIKLGCTVKIFILKFCSRKIPLCIFI